MKKEKTKIKVIKKLPKKVLDAFNGLVIRQCSMCGAFISNEEWKQFEGVCKRHWDY